MASRAVARRLTAAWVCGLVVAGLVAAGCSGVPTGGRAVTVRNVPPLAVDDDPDVRLEPREPGPADAPDKVVRGFLAAAKSATERHAIARTFLAPDATDWPDSAGTRIITIGGLRVSTAATTASVVLTGRYQARLAPDGAYLPEDRPLSVTYLLRRVTAGWRVVNPPAGVLLPATDFQQVYKAVDLYFLSPDGQTVVPDRRYFDVKQAVLPTEMASRLLTGASSWLAPGVRTAFPAGTHLQSNVVKDSDIFVVNLSAEVLTASRPEQVALAAQLVWTLAKRFSVRGIRVLADGRPLRVQSDSGLVGRDAYTSYDPRVLTTPVPGYYLADGSLRAIGAPVPDGPAARPGAGLLSAAVSTDLGRLAAVRHGTPGAQLIVGPRIGPLTVRYTARTMTRPSWEAGAAAVFVAADGRTVLRVPLSGAAAQVPAPGLERVGAVSALVLSRDGVRIAVVAGVPGRGHLLVGVLSRAGTQVALAGLREVAAQLTDVADVAWTDEAELLVLAGVGGSARAPYVVDVDGATVTERPTTDLPTDRRQVAAAPGQPDLVEAGGRIWRRSGAGWASPGAGPAPRGSMPFYPG